MEKSTFKYYLFIAIGGIVFAVLDAIFGRLVWGYLFAEQVLSVQGMWRDMNSFETKTLSPIASLIAGLGIACLVAKVPFWENTKCYYMRGVCVGFKIFLIAGVYNSLMWYAHSAIPKAILSASLMHGALSFIIGTIVVSRIVGYCGNMVCTTTESNRYNEGNRSNEGGRSKKR